MVQDKSVASESYVPNGIGDVDGADDDDDHHHDNNGNQYSLILLHLM